MGFRLARDDFQRQPGFPVHALEELAAVGRLPTCLGGDQAIAVDIVHHQLGRGTPRAPPRPVHRLFRQAPGQRQPLPQPHDTGKGVDDVERLAGRARHQQAAVVGAEIERGIDAVAEKPPLIAPAPMARLVAPLAASCRLGGRRIAGALLRTGLIRLPGIVGPRAVGAAAALLAGLCIAGRLGISGGMGIVGRLGIAGQGAIACRRDLLAPRLVRFAQGALIDRFSRIRRRIRGFRPVRRAIGGLAVPPPTASAAPATASASAPGRGAGRAPTALPLVHPRHSNPACAGPARPDPTSGGCNARWNPGRGTRDFVLHPA